jgi:predicted RNA-binding protein with RPS1 domain
MKSYKVGDAIEGTVVRVMPKYAILLFDGGKTGLLHISELSKTFVRNFTGFVQVGNIYKVKVIACDETQDFMKVSLKKMTPAERKKPLSKKRVDAVSISFDGLAKRLPEWVEEENKKENV